MRQFILALGRSVILRLPFSANQRIRMSLRFRRSALARLLGVSSKLGILPHQVKKGMPTSKEQVRAQAHQRLLAFLATGDRLVIPHSDEPIISILVILYNQAGLTLECLKGLAVDTTAPFELIIIDNASSDETSLLFERVDGVHFVRNTDNLGFVLAVNQAAALARGRHLLMLNNDAVPLPGTLAAALQRIESDAKIGGVGGRILLYNGLLQEAGNIVWRDGSCLGYGRNGDPEAPEYRFVRDVDYCSGAFLLVRRELFKRLGGLDEAFVPAYYEEVDFCFSMQEAGYRIVFDPKVVVRHFEFASSSTSASAIELQVKNRGIFRERHLQSLARRYQPDISNSLFARGLYPEGVRRVLFIDDRVPHPSLGSGYPRSQEFVRAIVDAGHFVTFYPLQFREDDWNEIYKTLPETVEVMLHHGVTGISEFLAARTGYYDVMIVSRPHNMLVLAEIKEHSPEYFSGVTLIYDAEAVFATREILKAEILGTPLTPKEGQRLKSSELDMALRTDHVTVVSANEARYFTEYGVRSVSVIGHTLELKPTLRSFAERRDFLFVGALYADDTPNTDSLVWFVENVWPRVVAKLGVDVKLRVAGPCTSTVVSKLAAPNIEILGKLDNLDELYDRSRVFIVPTRFAAGIPLKALEAAAYGVPMVATPLIAQQLGWESELLIAADAEAFAASCVTLHEDEQRWNETRRNALERVAQDCDPGKFSCTVADMISAVQPIRSITHIQ